MSDGAFLSMDFPTRECRRKDLLSVRVGYHSYLSTWNNVGVHKWWIPSIVCAHVKYLADGVAPAQVEGEGGPFCAEECTTEGGSCAYDCATQSVITCGGA